MSSTDQVHNTADWFYRNGDYVGSHVNWLLELTYIEHVNERDATRRHLSCLDAVEAMQNGKTRIPVKWGCYVPPPLYKKRARLWDDYRVTKSKKQWEKIEACNREIRAAEEAAARLAIGRCREAARAWKEAAGNGGGVRLTARAVGGGGLTVKIMLPRPFPELQRYHGSVSRVPLQVIGTIKWRVPVEGSMAFEVTGRCAGASPIDGSILPSSRNRRNRR